MYSVKYDLPVQRMVRSSQAERLHSLCLIWRCADDQSLRGNEIDIREAMTWGRLNVP